MERLTYRDGNGKAWAFLKQGCSREEEINFGRKSLEKLASYEDTEEKGCDGCIHIGKYENEVEYGLPSPCTICKRRTHDNYTT